MHRGSLQFVSLILLVAIRKVQNEERLCASIDVRNYPENLSVLRNCSVVVGYLQIVLMDNSTSEDFKAHVYPELVEVTSFVLLYRVRGLISLSDMFPNLRVIRGYKLLANYALVIYDMPDMQNIGLRSLLSIQHGKVRLEYNPRLCYVNTIDWKNITNSYGNSYMSNQLPHECALRENCDSCPGHLCWAKGMCQNTRDEPGCHQQCIGDCYGPGPHQCKVCKGFKDSDTCVEKCSPERFMLHDSLRCVLPKRCRGFYELGGVLHDRSCLPECPAGYMRNNSVCKKCPKLCPKVCDGGIITTIADAEHFKGCTHINGSLQIKLTENSDISEELTNCLNEIEEIRGILKIHRSFSLKSLNFMSNLKVIFGERDLESNKYSLLVFENQNLQNLFNVTDLEIKNGAVLFNNNPYLCLSEIEKFQLHSNISKFTINDAIPNWNGYKASCSSVKIKTFTKQISTTHVTLYWEHFKNTSTNGYMIYHIRAPERNLKIYYGMDTCLENAWNGTLVKIDSDDNFLKYTLTELEPFTQYAYYIKSYDLDNLYKVNSLKQEVQSDLKYFQTLTDQPSGIQRIKTISKNSSSLTITWLLPATPNGVLSHYKIYVFHHPDVNAFLDQRNYCLEPMEGLESNERYDIIQENPAHTQSCVCPDETPLISIDEEYQICSDNADSPYSCSKFEYGVTSRRTKRALTPQVRLKQFTDMMIDGYYEIATKTFSAELTKYTVNHLRYYGLYTLQLAACNTNENNDEVCSPIEYYTDRVARKVSADDILDFGFVMNGRDVILKWCEPERPNGVVVTYILEYGKYDTDNALYMVKCITRLQHSSSNFTHTLSLPLGLYKARVRAQSLAGEGRFTPQVEFNVTRLAVNGTESGFIGLYCMPVIGIIIILVYCLRKHNYSCLNIRNRLSFNRNLVRESAARLGARSNFGFNDDEQEIHREILFDEITNQLFEDTSPSLGLIKRDYNVQYTPYPSEFDGNVSYNPNIIITRATIESHING